MTVGTPVVSGANPRATATAAEIAVIESGLRIACEVARTAAGIVHLPAAMRAVFTGVDDLLVRVHEDVDAVAAQVGPALTLLLTLPTVTAVERGAMLDAVHAMSDAGARGRADEMRRLLDETGAR